MRKIFRTLLWSLLIIAGIGLIVPRFVTLEYFACSDYCPGPREQYIGRVHPVLGKTWCRLVGGTPVSYYGWGKINVCDAKTKPISTIPTQTNTLVSPTQTPDRTADWKMYNNTQYGFQIKYPPIGEVFTGTHYGGGIQANGETQFAVKYQLQTGASGPDEGFVIFSAMPLSSAPKQNADDLFTIYQQTLGTLKERYGTENYTVRKFTVGNDKGVLYYLFTPGTPGGGSGGCSMNVEVFHGNSFFVLPAAIALTYAPEVVSNDCANYILSNFNLNYRTILSTLKFTK